MTPEELAAIKDALPLAQSRVRCMLETDRGNLVMMGAQWTAEDVKPMVDAVPALVAEVERLRAVLTIYADAENWSTDSPDAPAARTRWHGRALYRQGGGPPGQAGVVFNDGTLLARHALASTPHHAARLP